MHKTRKTDSLPLKDDFECMKFVFEMFDFILVLMLTLSNI